MGSVITQARSDAHDRLVLADEPLAGLQLRCGGELPGTIAMPALLELVRKARSYGLKLARTIRANDGVDVITAWVEIEPESDGACAIAVHSWQTAPLPPEEPAVSDAHRAAIDRAIAELTVRLDPAQRVLTVEADAADTAQVAAAMRSGMGQPWTDFVEIEGNTHRQPLHWRLLDGARVRLPGSSRSWRASILPQEIPGSEPIGFELCLVAETPLTLLEPQLAAAPAPGAGRGRAQSPLGQEIVPVLRQPIARIIGNAQTIRSRLAGPLADEYTQYAADIAAAGQHLLSLVEDMADLEAVEAEDFDTAPEIIDLADAARRASGILAVRAQERGISIDPPRLGERLPAIAEYRRVLQILLNLIGNAINYSPEASQIWVRLEDDGPRARVIVADQGPGLSLEQQQRVFEKFERLGRSDEHGSGLGLYISRKLARKMGGDLTIDSAPGQGARFILDVPAAPAGSAGDPARSYQDQ